MFAPWCPSCSAHVLLGTRRLEQIDHGPGGPRVVLRCFCDALLVWSAASEASDPLASDQRGRSGPDQSTGVAVAVPAVGATSDTGPVFEASSGRPPAGSAARAGR